MDEHGLIKGWYSELLRFYWNIYGNGNKIKMELKRISEKFI
jgi:hypothetical protein